MDLDFFKVIYYVVLADAKSKKGVSTQEPLRDALLRDTLSRAVENDMASYQTVINNIAEYVEVVHHTDYSADLMQCEYHGTILSQP